MMKHAESMLSFERVVAHIELGLHELDQASNFFEEIGLTAQSEFLDVACDRIENEILATLEWLQEAAANDQAPPKAARPRTTMTARKAPRTTTRPKAFKGSMPEVVKPRKAPQTAVAAA